MYNRHNRWEVEIRWSWRTGMVDADTNSSILHVYMVLPLHIPVYAANIKAYNYIFMGKIELPMQ